MKTQVTFPAEATTLDVLAKFLMTLEKISPEPVQPPKAVLGEDNIVFVEVGYQRTTALSLSGSVWQKWLPIFWKKRVYWWLLLHLWLRKPGKAENGAIRLVRDRNVRNTNLLNLASAQKDGGEANKCHTASLD
jgi:hypothetical protein